MSAMPMMPMEPAKAMRIVRAFFVIRLCRLSDSAVRNDMDVLPVRAGREACGSSAVQGCVSSTTLPSSRRMMRVE